MLNKNQRIFENTVYSADEILLLESLHLKFVNERRVYCPNPYHNSYYANVPKLEALNPSDFDNYESIKTFFYSELEEGRSKFKFFKRRRNFGVSNSYGKYSHKINYGLKNNKPIAFHISDIIRDIKHPMICTYNEVKLDIK